MESYQKVYFLIIPFLPNFCTCLADLTYVSGHFQVDKQSLRLNPHTVSMCCKLIEKKGKHYAISGVLSSEIFGSSME